MTLLAAEDLRAIVKMGNEAAESASTPEFALVFRSLALLAEDLLLDVLSGEVKPKDGYQSVTRDSEPVSLVARSSTVPRMTSVPVSLLARLQSS